MHESSALTHIRKLTNSSVNCSQLDVELLMMHVLKLKKNELYRDNPQINDQNKKDILSLIKRREDGEPLAYLINEKGFRNLELYVDRNVWFQDLKQKSWCKQSWIISILSLIT